MVSRAGTHRPSGTTRRVNPLQFHPMTCDRRLAAPTANITFVLARFETSGHADPVVLRSVAVVAGRGAVEEPQRAPAHAVEPPSTRRSDEVTRGLNSGSRYFSNRSAVHDVRVAIDKPMAMFHLRLPCRPSPGMGITTHPGVCETERKEAARVVGGCAPYARKIGNLRSNIDCKLRTLWAYRRSRCGATIAPPYCRSTYFPARACGNGMWQLSSGSPVWGRARRSTFSSISILSIDSPIAASW